jgi:YHS domain-containing protein
MKKLLAVFLSVMFLMSLAVSPVFAAEKTVNVGNTLCPVSGEPVSGNNFVEYQGKRYGLCCPACEKMFLAEPEKYIAKMNAQEAAPASSASKEMERGMEQKDF